MILFKTKKLFIDIWEVIIAKNRKNKSKINKKNNKNQIRKRKMKNN